MMGERRVQQEALFYEFSLERHVPETHLLRHIDRSVELDGLRRQLVPFYSEMGRPLIDPELLIRMLIVGYCLGIRSASALSGGCAKRCTSTWRIAGSVGSGSTARCRITRHSQRIAMAVSGTAICCGDCSRPCCSAASPKASSAVKASPSMPA